MRFGVILPSEFVEKCRLLIRQTVVRYDLVLGPLANLDEQPPVSIEVGGYSGHFVDIIGSESHILGVVSTRGGMTWFFKLTGPDPLVADQKAVFESFVRSIKF